MDFDDYQIEAVKTAAVLPPIRHPLFGSPYAGSSIELSDTPALLRGALGVCDEAGEVAGIVKKYCFQGHTLDRLALFEEMGDVLWYLAVMAKDLGMDLEYIAKLNIAKLHGRYPKEFSAERSMNRNDQT